MTNREAAVLRMMKAAVAQGLAPPNYAEMSVALGVRSKANITRIMHQLHSRGLVYRDGSRWMPTIVHGELALNRQQAVEVVAIAMYGAKDWDPLTDEGKRMWRWYAKLALEELGAIFE